MLSANSSPLAGTSRVSRKIKVLTLGWEFPPLYAGGLGPACHGLTKALSKHVEQTIILPRSDAQFKMSNVEIMGLNHIDDNLAQAACPANAGSACAATNQAHGTSGHLRQAYAGLEFTDIHEIPMSLSVYPTNVSHDYDVWNTDISEAQARQLFSEKDIYGPNIMQKVAAYSEMVCKIAEEKEFDVIHAHDWITYPAAVKLKKKTGKPLVVHVHSLETDRVHVNSRNRVYDIEHAGMTHADCICPVSHFTRKNIIAHYGIEEEKIFPVYNGIEAAAVERNDANKKEKRVLFLGRITSQKGPQYFIEAAKKLLERMNNVRFYMAGTGDMMEHLKYLVRQNGLEQLVVFTGFLSKQQVLDLLSTTDAYMMPSVSEPFGLSALEAAQFNIPCIISKQSGAAEVMPNALQVDFWDTDKMASYLYAVLKYEGLAETLTEKTSEQLPNINWDVAAEKVLKRYEALTAQTKPSLRDMTAKRCALSHVEAIPKIKARLNRADCFGRAIPKAHPSLAMSHKPRTTNP